MEAVHLTNRVVRDLTPPRGRAQLVVRDSWPDAGRQRSLYLKVGKRARSFFIQRTVDGRLRYIPIGRFGEVTVDEARQRARWLHRLIDSGEYRGDELEPVAPVDEPEVVTVDDALSHYLADKGHKLAASTVRGYRNDIRFLNWGHRELRSISKTQVKAKMGALADSHPSGAISAFKTLSTLYRHLAKEVDDLPNPVEILTDQRLWPDHDPLQKRFRCDADWGLAMAVAKKHPTWLMTQNDHWWFCALTGLRPRQEAAALRWSEVDFQARTITVPAERLKAKRRRNRPANLTIPMTAPLEELLRKRHEAMPWEYLGEVRSQFVFPNRRKTSRPGHLKENATLVAAIEAALQRQSGDAAYDIETYSLRRFYVKTMRELTIDFEVRNFLLDHEQPRLQDRVYDALTVEDCRDSAEQVAAHLLRHVAAGAKSCL